MHRYCTYEVGNFPKCGLPEAATEVILPACTAQQRSQIHSKIANYLGVSQFTARMFTFGIFGDGYTKIIRSLKYLPGRNSTLSNEWSAFFALLLFLKRRSSLNSQLRRALYTRR